MASSILTNNKIPPILLSSQKSWKRSGQIIDSCCNKKEQMLDYDIEKYQKSNRARRNVSNHLPKLSAFKFESLLISFGIVPVRLFQSEISKFQMIE